MRTAVYSGTFNPLHVGHQAIMSYLTGPGGFDRVYLVVSPQNPFKDPSLNLLARERLEKAREAVARHPELKVSVDDIEFGMEPPQYTINTLDALQMREPENDFTLVIGADNLVRFGGWREHVRILSEYGVVVFPRSGFNAGELREALMQEPEGDAYMIRIMEDAPLVDVSSTLIREGLAKGLDISEYLM